MRARGRVCVLFPTILELKLSERHEHKRCFYLLTIMQRTVCLLINKENPGDEMIDKGMKDELMIGNGYHDVVCWHRIVQSYWIGRTFF